MFWLSHLPRARPRARRGRLHLVAEAISDERAAHPRSSWWSCWRPRRLHLLRRQPKPADRRRRKEKAFAAVKAEDIEEVQIGPPDGEATRAEDSRHAWKIVEPVAGRRRRGRAVEHHQQPGVARNPARGRREAGRPESSTASSRRAIDVRFRSKGQTGRTPDPARREDADRRRPLRQAARPPRVFLVAVVPRLDVQQETPFALRDKAILKVDREKADGLEVTAGATHADVRQERTRTGRSSSRSPRAPTSPRSRAPSSGCRRRRCRGSRRGSTRRPEAVRARPADGDDDDRRPAARAPR